MKWWIWLIISLAFFFVTMSLMFIITRIIIKPPKSWWWTGGLFLFEFILGLLASIIFLVIKLSKPKSLKTRLSSKDAEAKAIKAIKYDESNPDNFVVNTRTIINVGQDGYKRTPILKLSGWGSEFNEKIDALINMDSTKLEMSVLRNETEAMVEKVVQRMAENPEVQITTTRSISMDNFGRPIRTETEKKPSHKEKEQKEQETQADMANTF